VAPHAERISKLECHAYHPDATQKMVGVGVGNKEVIDVLTGYFCLFQLGEDTITSTCINKQHPFFAMKSEASVVASGSQCVTCAKHGDIVVLLMHV
jgi:hypothetical protein